MKRDESRPNRLDVSDRTSRNEGPNEIHELKCRVQADLVWFDGHFEGNPILPAVVQLREVQLWVRQLWPDLDHPRAISRAKFQRPIRPEDLLGLRLARRRGSATVSFLFRCGGQSCSSGHLSYEVRA